MEPVMRWLVIGGTTESLAAVAYLLSKKAEVYVSVTTDMGAGLYEKDPVTVWKGQMDAAQFEEKIRETGISHVLDASHPYAVEVTRTVRNVCRDLGIAYFRYTRKDSMGKTEAENLPKIYHVSGAREAALMASILPGKILLTVGVKTLDIYCDLVTGFQARCYARILDNEASKSLCEVIFKNPRHWIVANPPFDVEDNRKLLRETGASILITKDSGAAGGLPEKLEAARLEGASVILISRPKEDSLQNLENLNRYFILNPSK